MEIDPSSFGDIVTSLGIVGLLAAALVGAYKRWYVFRPEFEDERADKNEWKTLALDALQTANAATNVAEKVATDASK